MSLLDKAKFWKKGDDGLGDMSDVGDFGLDNNDSPAGGSDSSLGATDLSSSMPDSFSHPEGGPLSEQPSAFNSSLDEGAFPPMNHTEEVKPTAASQAMGAQLGLSGPQTQPPSGLPPTRGPGMGQPAQPQPPQPFVPQQPNQSFAPPQANQNVQTPVELTKDIEIIHAKLDAIKSSLDSINQRLVTIERMSSSSTGTEKTRYSW